MAHNTDFLRLIYTIFPLQKFIADTATKAVATVAILLLELDERLAVGCILDKQSTIGPGAYDIIVLGLQLFEQGDGLFAISLTVLAAPVVMSGVSGKRRCFQV